MTLLVPERMLVFSPALAATIGLEEAVLLHVLHDLSVSQPRQRANSHSYTSHWIDVEVATLEGLLPFWDRRELQRVSKSLSDKGVIRIDSPPVGHTDTLRFCFAAETQSTRAETRSETRMPSTPITPRPGSAGQLANNWRPEEDLLQLLALNHGISRDFALKQVEDFVLYWRERGEVSHAWSSRFRQHVLRVWRLEQQQHNQTMRASREPENIGRPENAWRPSADALQILERAGINHDFIEDAIPEFVLYWRERGHNDGTWNSKFIAHVRKQWARFENALAHEQEPRPISANWQPSEDVYDILRMANIDFQFACEVLPEFILFWRDAGTPQRSWNTKFLQHVKYQWATRHHMNGGLNGAPNRAGSAIAAGTDRAAPSNAFERLTDRSWASGIVDGI
ncbi:MAG: DnaT-like ssDNA-binding domain-containing protein [Spongiibacteraceae bacterium]